MIKKLLSTHLLIAMAIFVIMALPSCVVTKKSVYFTDMPDTAILRSITPAEFKEPVIQPDDILSITVQTIDPTTTAAVNQVSAMPAVGASSASSTGQQLITGFLVDKNGNVAIPMIGALKLGGLTTYQARELIQQKATFFFKDPTVQVRFANYKITVIGEVNRPAAYTVPNEKVTLLDAIGLAGDLTIYGKRDNVLLIRDNADKKEFIRFNLNSSDILKSPYFYLKQNDVIYIEPGKGKIAANNVARTQSLAIVGSILSVLIVLLTRI
ncbi:Polysaccharide export outer membrane protein [Arcticibacter svalbardensis MN12-7]|uniref:Polysaccharide export outer membrane protein n=1 Tax=Arcticibacter svalbardensis MN12-7 TaxID=1150600 RepID=R9GQG5_9SPHI|nr:polysaccharide biosynthesis/export family protein [Arcticibacter svalbardensis]EOR94072.1 Polysaccharide export outer membrane protein [Arcticibacter svalbardensis MN12-7]